MQPLILRMSTKAQTFSVQADPNKLRLQGWLVLAFVGAERMARAGRGGQTCKAGVAGATMPAHIFGFLAALIQGVQALVCARRVAWTVGSSQAGDAGVFGSTIFTIVVHS
jgi:hypothetical protein